MHLQAGLALAETANGNASTGLSRDREALTAAGDNLGVQGAEVMAQVRLCEGRALAGAPPGPERAEALDLLRRRGMRRWVASALTLAALAHEAAGRAGLAPRLLGGAAAATASLGQPPLPLPAIAKLLTLARDRRTATL